MPDIKDFANIPAGAFTGEFDSLRQKLEEFHAHSEDYVRQNPTQSVLSAAAIGFVFHLLPVGALVGACTRLLAFALRPALFIYGAVMLYKQFQKTSGEHKG